MVWLFILLLVLIIAPEVLIMLFAIIMAIVLSFFELLFKIFGVGHEKDDEKQ
jgi:hypothetical protein